MDLVPSGFFVLRTPLLPFDAWTSWAAGTSPQSAGDERDRARAAIRALITRPAVREALFVGSPDLESRIDAWIAMPETQAAQRIERALVRYLTRMSMRPTPFGLFAGITVGTIGTRTRVELVERARYRRQTQLDGAYLEALVREIAGDPEFRAELCYRPNTSIYPAAGRVRYVETRRTGDASVASAERPRAAELSRSYGLADVADTPYLRSILALAAAGGATVRELATALASNDGGPSLDESSSYILQLIDNQLLVPDLPLPVTGPQPAAALATALRESAGTKSAVIYRQLVAVSDELASLDACGTGAGIDRYRAVAELLAGLPAPVTSRHLVRVDLFKPAAEAVIGHAVFAEIARGVEILHRVGRPVMDPLEQFRERFRERYADRSVPLAEALDREDGIGFDDSDVEPLLKTLDLRVAPQRAREIAWGERETLLLAKLGEALASNAREIMLEQRDIDALTAAVVPEPRPLPRALAAVASIAAASAVAIDRGEFLVYVGGAAGPSGAPLLGRFCHGDDELGRRVAEHLRAEEALDPETIYAEVVHSPAGRLNNILARPVLREREIVYLGASGAPRERQLTIADLMVSLEADRVVLRNAADGRRIVPRLTSAHNHALRQNLPIYRFLCALQTDGSSGAVRWDWGPLATAPFLPRVRAGRLVLALAQWRVLQCEVRALAEQQGAVQIDAVRRWRARRQLSRLVAVDDGDTVLPIDLESALGVDTFVHMAKERESGVMLTELFPGPDELWVRGPEGRFTHEVIVPFVAAASDQPSAESRMPARRLTSRPAASAVTRSFAPGSHWLYAKLYGGTATADRVLRRLVGPLVRRVRAEGLADRWFFIRYRDPDPHLRVRFHGDPGILRGSLLAALHEAAAPLLADGALWRLQLDTYDREIERYGGDDGVHLHEAMFEADSDAVLEIVERASSLTPDDRWRVALCGIDQLLSDLGFSEDERHAIVTRARDGYRSAHHAGPKLGRQLGERFRAERARLSALLAGDASSSPPAVQVALDSLRRRSEHLAPIVRQLRERDGSGKLVPPLIEIAPSLMHMFAIRLLRADARMHEVVLYDFLARLYTTRAADAKGRATAGATRRPI